MAAPPPNIVSQPPLTTRMVDANGNPSRAWAIWFRDLYVRTSYKGGNAIDAESADLTDIIAAINANIENIEANASAIEATNAQITENTNAISTTSSNLSSHVGVNSAHGSNGAIVGSNDFATNSTAGLVKSMSSLAVLAASTANITIPDLASAPATYNQAYMQSVATMANEAKLKINQLTADLNATIDKVNSIISESKLSGQMDD